jgi:hypothetical protein
MYLLINIHLNLFILNDLIQAYAMFGIFSEINYYVTI